MTELTKDEIQAECKQVSDMIDAIEKIIDGEKKGHMLTSFAYILASQVNNEEEAREAIMSLCDKFTMAFAMRVVGGTTLQ